MSLTTTVERVREVLDYDPRTGVLTWKALMARNNNIGKPAGGPDKLGYICLNIDKKRYYAHRIAWLHYYGEWPKNGLDHMDGDPANNRIENLRDVSHLVNQQNRRKPAAERKHGLPLGVFANASPTNPYTARIRVDGAPRHIGNFATPEAAHDAYLIAKRQLHEGCTI